jgi:hypothetical protein
MYNFFRKPLIIIQNLMFLVVFIDKSDRFADLPYSVVTKMASVREQFQPNQSTISTKIMTETLANNEKLFARISGNRCSYMDWHTKNIGLVKFALDSSNLNVVRWFTHLLHTCTCKWDQYMFMCIKNAIIDMYDVGTNNSVSTYINGIMLCLYNNHSWWIIHEKREA